MRVDTYWNSSHSYTEIHCYDDYNNGFTQWIGNVIGLNNTELNRYASSAKKVSYNGNFSKGFKDGVYVFNFSNITLNKSDKYDIYWGFALDIETVSGKHSIYDLYPKKYNYIGYNFGSESVRIKNYSSYDRFPISYSINNPGMYAGGQGPLTGTISVKDSGPERIKKITFYLMQGNISASEGYGYSPNLLYVEYADMGELVGGFNIKFDVNGGSISIPNQIVNDITLPNPGTRPGYTFDGWYNGNTKIGVIGDKWKPTADAAITAHWTPITYRIQYLTYGGYVTGNPVTYNVETPTFTLKNPTQMNMSFTGWSDRNNNIPKTEYTIPKGSIGDITVSANWASTDTKHGRDNSNGITSNKFTVK